MIIGKADPNNHTKMICRDDLDQPQLQSEEVPSIITPTEDVYQVGKQKCMKTIRKRYGKDYTGDEIRNELGINDDNDEGTEYAWYLRQCCPKTAKLEG